MYTKAMLMFMYSETSLHVGSGTSLSAIDLPIQREKYTNFPAVAGSGVKGAVREWFENSGLHVRLDETDDGMLGTELQAILKKRQNGGSNNSLSEKEMENLKWVNQEFQKIKIIFGPEKEGSDHAGAVAFSDARILLFPVRSMKGVFAYVTCPLVLERLQRDIELSGNGAVAWQPPLPSGGRAIGTSQDDTKSTKDCSLKIENQANQAQVVLEEYAFELSSDAGQCDKANGIARWLSDNVFPGTDDSFWKQKIRNSLLILSDDDFKDFVEHSTEVNARIKLGEGKSTSGKGGNLFYEENLPPETVMYSLVLASIPHAADSSGDVDSADNIMNYVQNLLAGKRMQLGGDETLGKGIVNIKFLKKNQEK